VLLIVWCVCMCVAQSDLDLLVRDHDNSHNASSLSVDMKQTFDRWYSDQMTSSHRRRPADNVDNSDAVDGRRQTTPLSPGCRLSNGHVRPGAGHGRTWFDPVSEIPQLQRWLRQNSHPTRCDMARYARELNAGPHRQALQRPLDVNNVAYWFKNARARAGARTSLNSNNDDRVHAATDSAPASSERPDEHVPELPNSNAVYVVSPLLPRHGSDVTDDVTEARHVTSRKRRRRSVEPDENHNERCTSSMSSSSSLSEMASAVTPAGLDDDEDRDNGEATDLSVRRTRSSSSLSVQSDDRGAKTDKDHGQLVAGQLHPALASTTTAPLSLSLHVQQALQHQMQLAMRYMQHPLYPAAVPTAPAQRWLPWLGAGAKPELDDDSSTACSTTSAGAGAGETPGSAGEVRRKRSRVFIDPLSEIPRLEQWFAIDSHPSSTAIERLTDELNRSAYRQRFPPLEPKNVQLWFKNHRAKVKRQSLESLALTSQLMSDVKDDDVKLPASSTPLPSNHYSTANDVMAVAADEAVS